MKTDTTDRPARTAPARLNLSARNEDIKAKLGLIRRLLDDISPPRAA